METKQTADENQTLLSDKKASYDTEDHHRRHSSRLEWTESSWTRFLHMVFWCWVNPILLLGYKQQLNENDLDDVPHVDKSSLLLDRLNSYDWSTSTTSRIVINEFWKDYIFANLFLIPTLIVRIAQPLLFRQIILNMMDKQELNTLSYLYAILLFICVILQSLTHRQNIFSSARVGVRIRNALTMIIYKRALSLKLASWEQRNTGQIINLIANDVSKFEEMYSYLGYLCGGLLEAIIIFGLLCWIMHPIPVLCGYTVFPLVFLIQLYFNRKFGQYREIISICTDKRLQAFSELIHGCHVVKMYNWEKPIEDRIAAMRDNEFACLRRISRFRALNRSLFFISTSLLSLITFGSAWFLGYPLNAANTFPVLAFFSIMRINIMFFLPLSIEKLSEARSASRRIDSFMHSVINQKNHSPSSTCSVNQKRKGSIILYNGSFSWHNEEPCLSSLDLTIEQGTFVGIAGPVGSGKSSLLNAILGEMNLINGELNTNGSSFSYAAQSPWIFTDTFRNNILLNRSFDEQLYRNVIHACCLDVDLDIFGSSRDLTVIGEKGVNLSGGQKARVSLARALYADADVYLLDDPLSAVDRTVAKQIYERCIGSYGLLKNKTRLLVTHHTQFLSEANQTIFLSHGRIDMKDSLDKNITKKSDDTHKNETSVLVDMLHDNIAMTDAQPIITDEISLTGSVKWSVWYHLFSSPPFGRFGFCLLIILLLLGEVLNDGTNYWLSAWLKQSHIDQQRSPKFAYIYFGMIVATIVADIVRTNYYFTVIFNGSHNLHNKMLRGLLYTSIQFFESNPSGRILNRVSKDQHVIDELLPTMLLNGVITLLLATGSIVIVCFLDPYLFILLILLVPVIWLIIRFYERSFPQLKRIENVTRSPVYAQFASSMNGLATIRAFKAEKSFVQIISDKIDANTSAYITVQGALQWLSVILNVTCCLILLVSSLRVVASHNQMDTSTVALSLMSSMFLSLWLQWAFRELSEANIMMTSAERIDEYSRLPQEDDKGSHKGLVKTSSTWPTHGTIEFRNYSLRHRFNLAYAIRNINLQVESHQKIGIIGRTGMYYINHSFLICFMRIGAGKSSLFKGIFRFTDRSNVDGEILIDNVDISRITLNHLRSHLSVIPQQPILFSGTLRYNLDPFNHYSDEQCWMALEDVQLKQFVSNHSDGLLLFIAESGSNLSEGQRQLICIARAILKKSKILLIDEGTSNVDQTTDGLIQEVITKKFKDRTVMTIAHRLNTVAKSDRILVLDKGMIVNYDTPTNIMHYYD
ncbi:unnamed protein product [Rotaria sp. Silwood2]|nr:unnamed protein product [Rotaria sp. Silwood2]CAF4370733.1 unnamed protein product [Rotaria sp. Silwood2]